MQAGAGGYVEWAAGHSADPGGTCESRQLVADADAPGGHGRRLAWAVDQLRGADVFRHAHCRVRTVIGWCTSPPRPRAAAGPPPEAGGGNQPRDRITASYTHPAPNSTPPTRTAPS